MPESDQVEQFVTINSQAKGVPKSLLLDLLKSMPQHTAKMLAESRAVDVVDQLRKNPESVFYNRVVVVSAPVDGQISMNNFVRKLLPIVHPERGRLKNYTLQFQVGAMENYFEAVAAVYPEEWKKKSSIFFKTVGFGALMNSFEDIFEFTTARSKGFRVRDIKNVLSPVSDFDFGKLAQYGSGNKAEMQASADFLDEFKRASNDSSSGDGGLEIPL